MSEYIRIRASSHMDKWPGCSPWSPNDLQGCSSYSVYQFNSSYHTSELDKEPDKRREEDRSGIHRTEGLSFRLVLIVCVSSTSHAPNSNTCWKWWKPVGHQLKQSNDMICLVAFWMRHKMNWIKGRHWVTTSLLVSASIKCRIELFPWKRTMCHPRKHVYISSCWTWGTTFSYSGCMAVRTPLYRLQRIHYAFHLGCWRSILMSKSGYINTSKAWCPT